ncbi:mannonate dehydratase [Phenylobacterium sp.]|jgi:mannonate dehydratase|uniref:mannonate dehydratase n=1 Tax=Phenylobacterium sp. TaxID=1871053 RepID=UPI0037C69A26
MTDLNRRHLLGATGAGVAISAMGGAGNGALAQARRPAGPRKPVLMKLGTQEPTDVPNLIRFQRYGVKNVCGWYTIADPRRLHPTVDELKAVVDLCAKYGVQVDLTDSQIGRGEKSAVMMMGSGAERDREIEAFQNTIRNCAAAGVPSIKYYLSVLPIMRSGLVPGRGDTLYNKWNYAEAVADPSRVLALRLKDAAGTYAERAGLPSSYSADLMWERITYFLNQVVPVANEYKVKLAQHPHDPGLPKEGFLQIASVLANVDGLKRFISIQESPYHGLNFCQGTVCEMLEKPAEQINDVIRYFGSRKKIFNVHFRNIRGGMSNNVAENFPDDGDIDMAGAVEAYREVGYDGMLCPDHIPVHRTVGGREAVESAEDQSWAFNYGYIRALLQSAAKARA